VIINLADEAATYEFAASLAPQLQVGSILCLDGPLGAGKTTLVRGLVAAMGGDPEQVHSPTFALVHQYASAKDPIFHCDFYRLAAGTQLEDLGGEEFFAEQAVYCLEWSERAHQLLSILPNHIIRVKITIHELSRFAQIVE
jgi:tRNA threonylcarbamoyl adenosine modification protein YjeE